MACNRKKDTFSFASFQLQCQCEWENLEDDAVDCWTNHQRGLLRRTSLGRPCVSFTIMQNYTKNIRTAWTKLKLYIVNYHFDIPTYLQRQSEEESFAAFTCICSQIIPGFCGAYWLLKWCLNEKPEPLSSMHFTPQLSWQFYISKFLKGSAAIGKRYRTSISTN